jgi:hypothetical protein
MMTPSQEVLHQGAGMVADSDQLTERRPFAFSRVERVVENDGIFKLHLVPAKGICHIQHPANEMTFLKVSVQDWMHYKFRKFWRLYEAKRPYQSCQACCQSSKWYHVSFKPANCQKPQLINNYIMYSYIFIYIYNYITNTSHGDGVLTNRIWRSANFLRGARGS